MIDIENYVVNSIQTKYAGKSISIPVVSTYQSFDETIPCVFIRETGNTVYTRTQDANKSERHVRVVYQLDIITDQAPLKANIKNLLSVADEAMRDMGFTRESSDILTNQDRTAVWATARYTAIVGEPKTVNNTKVYQIYR